MSLICLFKTVSPPEFIAHYFRDTYDQSLVNYPFINNNIQITRAEVWITNRGNRTEDVRNLVAIQDIGESDPTNIGLDQQPPGFINVPAGSFPTNGILKSHSNNLIITQTLV